MSDSGAMCRCAQSQCLECLVRANEYAKDFDEERDCPTFRDDDRSERLKVIERTCGVDFATMADTVATPRGDRVVVMVRAVLEPNSAVDWFAQSRTMAPCHQLFFFDKRRSVRTLKRLLGDCTVINHSLRTPSTMRTEQRVDASEWKACQCNRFGCPGTGHRFRQLQARTQHRFEVSANAVAHTECVAASAHYDAIGRQAESIDEASDESLVSALDHWRVFDSTTRLPLLPEAYDVVPLRACDYDDDDEYVDALVERYSAPREEAAKRCAHRCTDPLRFDTPVGRQLPHAALRVEPLDAARAKAFRRAGHTHCTPLCAARVAAALDRSVHEHDVLQELGACYAKLRDEAQQSGAQIAGDEGEVAEVCEKSECLAGTCAHMDLNRTMRPLLDEALAARGKRRAHATDCACLAEYYIEQCASQIVLDLVPLPTNPVYANSGDTVLDVESPLMRELGAKQAVLLLTHSGALDANPIDAEAARGTQRHFETAIARLPAVRRVLTPQFGAFTFAFDRERACFRFARAFDERLEDFFTRYAAAPSAHIPRPQQRRVRGRALDAAAESYDALLRDAQRLVGAELRALGRDDDAASAERARTLTEVALHRGMLRSGDSVRRRKAWLPPILRYCLDTALQSPQCIEHHARATLASSGATRMILGPVCERSIVDEMHATDNRRMLLARVATCLLAPTESMRQFAELVLFGAAALAIVELCDNMPNLRAAERTRVAEQERRALQAKRAEERRVQLAERAAARQRRAAERRERERAEENERRERERAEQEARAEAERESAEREARRQKQAQRRRERQKRRRAERERAHAVAQELLAAQETLLSAERERERARTQQLSLADYLRQEAQLDFFNGGAFSMLCAQ